MAKKQSVGVVTSGMRPSGSFHLGNYLGALSNWVELQDEFECFFFIVDWHALTDNADTSTLIDDTRTMAIDWLACGLDPEKSAIFVQSEIKELTEFHLLLSMTTPVTWLERVPTYKERINQQGIASPGYGLLGYPVLMAADVIIYGGTRVPVGEDQVPHVNLMQDIARRFNNAYGQVLKIPRVWLTEAKRVPGTDWRKMSKRYGNSIEIAMTEAETIERVRQCFTDPLKIRLGDPGHPIRSFRPKTESDSDQDIVGRDPETEQELVVENPGCVVYALHKIYSADEVETICTTCKDGTRGCVACKDELSSKINGSLKDIRARRVELVANLDFVDRVLAEGAAKARAKAQETMRQVRSAMKMWSVS